MATKKRDVIFDNPDECILSVSLIKCRTFLRESPYYYMLDIKYKDGDRQVMMSKNDHPNYLGDHEFDNNDEIIEFSKKLSDEIGKNCIQANISGN